MTIDHQAVTRGKPHTGRPTRNGLRRGTQFDVPVRKELVTVCVGMRGDAGQVKWCVPCRDKNFEMFNFFSKVSRLVTTK